MRTGPPRHHIPRRLALLAAVVLATAACGASDGRIAELEEENAALREELARARTEPATSRPMSTTSTALTASTATTSPPPPATRPSTTTTTTAPPETTAASRRDDEAGVLSVTDGDTLRVLVDGHSEPLRLIGINAPEGGECLAAEATGRLAELVGEGPVRLERDVSERDDYGRLLRYVYAGDVFVNGALVEEGLAVARRYQPDTARAAQLEAAQERAQAAGVGMWDPGACGTASGAEIEVGQIHYDAAGNDNHNLNDEWVEIRNVASEPVELGGWSVKDESASHRYHFPDGFRLEAGATVRLHTGCGPDSPTALYWCMQGSAVWNNSGDTVFILDPHGNVVVSKSYSG